MDVNEGASQLAALLRQAIEVADKLGFDLVAAHIELARETLQTAQLVAAAIL